MCAKFSILPGMAESNAQEFERGTLAKYSERLVSIGCQLVARRHGGGGAPSARALGSAPVGIPGTGIATTPLTQPPTELSHFSNFTTGFYYTTPNLELKKLQKSDLWPWH